MRYKEARAADVTSREEPIFKLSFRRNEKRGRFPSFSRGVARKVAGKLYLKHIVQPRVRRLQPSHVIPTCNASLVTDSALMMHKSSFWGIESGR
jgi:hypothetical protein